jgi:hypothetical protein
MPRPSSSKNIEALEIQAEPSRERVPNIAKFAPEPSPQLDKFERLSKEIGRPLSPASASSREKPRSKSTDGQEFSYQVIGSPNETQSPTSAYFSAERLRNSKRHSYVKTWRSHFTLTLGKWLSPRTLPLLLLNCLLDGGGVRGYSQLIILKALMEKVAAIEQSKLDDDGRRVESSFHPLSWEDDKSMKLQKRVVKTRTNTRKKTESLSKEKGKQVEKSSDTNSEGDAGSKFYPHHYFDWIAGTSTGG